MVDDETLAQFAAIIGTTPDRGRQYLELTDGDVEQAIELYFANGGAALGSSNTSDTTSPSHRPSVSQRPTRSLDQNQPLGDGVIHIDSDSEADNSDDDIGPRGHRPQAPAPRSGQAASSLNTLAGVMPPSGRGLGSTDDDEAIARRLQEEMYGESGVIPEMDPQGIRAPIARTTETLIGPDSFDPNDPEDMNAAVQQQIRARDTRRTRGKTSRLLITSRDFNANLHKAAQEFSIKMASTRYGMMNLPRLTVIAKDFLGQLQEHRKLHPSPDRLLKCIGPHTRSCLAYHGTKHDSKAKKARNGF